jgi:hypothetical protein
MVGQIHQAEEGNQCQQERWLCRQGKERRDGEERLTTPSKTTCTRIAATKAHILD